MNSAEGAQTGEEGDRARAPKKGRGAWLLVLLLSVAVVTAAATSFLKREPEAKAQLGQPVNPSALETTDRTKTEDLVSSAVEAVTVETRISPDLLVLTGQLQADEQSHVASRGGGIVREVLIERGSSVRAGDVLIRLDRTDPENRLREVRAEVEELALRLGLDQSHTSAAEKALDVVARQPDVLAAQAAAELSANAFQRDRELFRQKVISPAEMDKTRMQYESDRQRLDVARREALRLFGMYKTARARLLTAEQALTDTTVLAPFEGVIAERQVALGEMLQPGGRVATLVRMDPLRLVMTVPERQVGLISDGAKVEFTVAAFPGQTFTGQVRHVAPSVSENSRSLTMEANVPNPDRRLRPGFFTNAHLYTGATRQTLHIPVTALGRAGEKAKVYVAVAGKLRERQVTLGRADEREVEIKTGLSAGDRVALRYAEATDGAQAR